MCSLHKETSFIYQMPDAKIWPDPEAGYRYGILMVALFQFWYPELVTAFKGKSLLFRIRLLQL